MHRRSTHRLSLLTLLLVGLTAACSSPADDGSSDDDAALKKKKKGTTTTTPPVPTTTCNLSPAITPKWEDGASGRPLGPMLWDSARGRMVVFTAQGTSALGPNGWSAPTGDPLPAGTRPEASIAYDSDRGRAVLFGGGDWSNLLGDTWEWDGAASTWTKMTPAGFTPRARWGHALAYDAARKKVVLFGGYAGSQAADQMEDTWTWDGAGWTRVGTPAQAHPEARFGHHMVFDAARGRVVLYGQYGGWYLGPVGGENSARGNTWEWDGTSWQSMHGGEGSFTSDDPTSLPMFYDAQHGRVARVVTSGARYQKTFHVLEWTGSSWSESTAGPGPKVDIASATQYYGAYDVARSRFVFGSSGYDWRTKELVFFAEPNRAPVLAPVANQRVFPGDYLSFKLTASDADHQGIRFDVSPLPAGASLDAVSGELKWSPTDAQVGTYTLTARASDGCADGQQTFTIRVEQFSYAGVPTGDVKLGGAVDVPVMVYQPQAGFSGSAKLACTVTGHNPGKLLVSCDGKSSAAWAYQMGTLSFTPSTLSAPLERDLTFAYAEGANNEQRTFRGRLEPLSDGTFKLHVTAWTEPAWQNGPLMTMNTSSPYGTTDAYGVVDVVP